jgi:hypothetical protein
MHAHLTHDGIWNWTDQQVRLCLTQTGHIDGASVAGLSSWIAGDVGRRLTCVPYEHKGIR